jgi:dolichol-phosphate mannosyltransferase
MNDCIIIPTYNEIENIESIIRSVLSTQTHILIVDDNSPDHTADKVRVLQSNLKADYFLENRNKKGRFRYRLCSWFKWALEKNMTIFLKWMLIFS